MLQLRIFQNQTIIILSHKNVQIFFKKDLFISLLFMKKLKLEFVLEIFSIIYICIRICIKIFAKFKKYFYSRTVSFDKK